MAFLEDYEMHMAKYLVQGVDIWLNTPRFPMEASGTSGMKAALNGVLHFSTLDGWWTEGYNGANGWGIQPLQGSQDLQAQDSTMPNSSTASWSRKSSLCSINVTLMEFLAAGYRWSRRASEPSRRNSAPSGWSKITSRRLYCPAMTRTPSSW